MADATEEKPSLTDLRLRVRWAIEERTRREALVQGYDNAIEQLTAMSGETFAAGRDNGANVVRQLAFQLADRPQRKALFKEVVAAREAVDETVRLVRDLYGADPYAYGETE